MTKKPKLYFEKRDKEGKILSRTPVLRLKRDEKNEDFLKRMNVLGYGQLEKLTTHPADNKVHVHVGPKESCRVCLRATKPLEKGSLSKVVPKSTNSGIPAQPIKPTSTVKPAAEQATLESSLEGAAKEGKSNTPDPNVIQDQRKVDSGTTGSEEVKDTARDKHGRFRRKKK